jgi:hypothetical protein
MKLSQTCDHIAISQEDYIRSTLAKYEKYGIRKTDIPAEGGQYLREPSDDDEQPDFPYSSAVGALLWITKTRPEILFAVSQICRFNSRFNETHVKAVMRVFGYLAKYPSRAIVHPIRRDWSPSETISVETYVDASHADDPESRKSSYGYVVYVQGCLISCRAKRTTHRALSSTEAEYVACSEGAREGIHVRNVLRDLELNVEPTIRLMEDNNGAIAWASNRSVNQSNKHIDLKWHYVRDLIENGEATISKVPSKDNVADIFTKNLGRIIFATHRARLSLQLPTIEADGR